MMEPLRQLTCKKSEWWWGPEHNQSVRMVSDAVTSAPVLRYFNPLEDVTVQADASDFGLGAVLLQCGHVVAYASRSMSQMEK